MPVAHKQISVLLCGKFASHISVVSAAVQTPFKIIKCCSTNAEAVDYLSTRPLAVRAAIMGAGFSMEDFTIVKDSPGGKEIPWLRPAHTNPDGKTKPPLGPPPPNEVAERVVHCLEEKERLFAEDGSLDKWEEGEVWYF